MARLMAQLSLQAASGHRSRGFTSAAGAADPACLQQIATGSGWKSPRVDDMLLDEPEAHLHPPLLSAFVRSLSDLLIQRNGVALIATHSPVILQEAPMSCVWVLRRSGASIEAERPELETSGENAGILTRAVFGLEVVDSGFHSMLNAAVHDPNAPSRTYEELLELFQGQLGAEARVILRALVSRRDAPAD